MEDKEYKLLFDLEDAYWWHKGLRLIADQLLPVRHFRPGNNTRVLDAGCGTGGWLKKINGSFWATGMDISDIALDFCRRRGMAESLVKGDVAVLPYRDNSFDIVTALDVLYHKNVVSDLNAIKEFSRILKPGGRLFINLAAYEFMRSYHDIAIHTKKRYTTSGVRRIFNGSGLRIIRLTYWNTILFPLAFIRKFLNIRSEGEGVSLPYFPAYINKFFYNIIRLEAFILKRFNLPYGLSIACVAEKI